MLIGSCRIPARAWSGVLAMCMLAAACGRSPSSSVITETDSAGVHVLTSHGKGWDAKSAWRLELDLDVGDLDGPNAFGRVRDVAVRRAGGMWVLDGQARHVRGFDDAGDPVLEFGGHGQGPGEFTFVDYVSELANGELVVAGSGPIALHRFGPDGIYRSTEILPDSVFRKHSSIPLESRPPPGPTFGKWRIAPDGSAFVQTVVIEADGESIVRSDVLLRLASGGKRATRLTQWNASVMNDGPDGTIRLLQPDRSWVALEDGGVWITDGAAYELRRLDRSGKLTTVVRRPVSLIPVTASIQRGVRQSLAENMDSDFERMLLDKAEYPANIPATFGLWVSEPSGRLWVGVRDPDLPWDYERANAWDILEPDGTYVGRMPIPAGFRATRVTQDYVVGIWLDELEVSHARRYSIVRPPG
ncbi:MAG: hypothetical protein V3S56_06385 [Gemmatimonadota bacterium]